LKNLITGETERVRNMRQDPIYVKSCCNYAFASNKTNSLKLEKSSRRFFVLHSDLKPLLNHSLYDQLLKSDSDCTPKVKELRYFRLLRESLETKEFFGLKTLVNFLYNLPTDNFVAQNIPQTIGLAKEQLANMNPVELFWFQLLDRGYNKVKDFKTSLSKGEEKVWEATISCDALYSDFKKCEQITGKRKFHWSSKEFQEQMLKMCPGAKLVKEKISKDWNLELPTLEECKSSFEKYMPSVSQLWTLETDEKSDDLFYNPAHSPKNRVGALSPDELMGSFLPVDFFGYPLLDKIKNKTFQCFSEEDFIPPGTQDQFNSKLDESLGAFKLLEKFNEHALNSMQK